jgi:nicotinamide mononucleotide transporter
LLHGQLPYFDSINFVVSFIAQLLYILKYQENWSLWIVVNLANILYWSILSIQVMTGATDIGSLGAYLSQVALQAALLFNSIYATKVWASGEADNEGGTKS